MIIAVNFPIWGVEKKKPEKIRASTRFEPMTSALPVRCSTNWAMKPHIGSEVNWVHISREEWNYVKYIYEIIHFWTAVVPESWFNWEVQSGGGRKFSDILYSVFNLVPRPLFPLHLQSQGKAPYYLFFNRELYVTINHLLADSVTIYVFYMIIYDCVVYMPLGGGGGGGGGGGDI